MGDINMHTLYKKTRNWFITASRTEYNTVMHEAKMTPRQYAIAEERFLKGKPNFIIAMDMNLSVQTVEREVINAYKAISRIVKFDLSV